MKFKTLMLLATIFSSVFLMEKRYATAYTPFVGQLLKGEAPKADSELERANAKKSAPYAILPGHTEMSTLNEAKPGSIAVIKVKGAIMKDDWCGYPGTETMARWTKEAGSNPNISAVLYDIDSGGGEADGTETFANSIKEVSKPTVAFVNTWACSAAYWIASATDEIVAAEEGSLIGSIGVMITIADYSKWYEEHGVKIHDIYSTLSPDKNNEFHEALKDNYKPMQKEILDPLAKVFHKTIKSNRGDKLNLKEENVMTGKVYYTEDAIKYGLVDSRGNMEFALQKATARTQEAKIKFS